MPLNKSQLKSTVSSAINFLGSLVYSSSAHSQNRSVVMAPSWEGSIGDEAVLDALTKKLQQRGDEVTLIHFGKNREWSHLSGVSEWLSIPGYFKTGGWKDRLKFILKFRKYTHFYLVGTDMLDGCYAEWLTMGMLTLANQAAITGLKTTLVGFSINKWQNANCIQALASFPKTARLCLRDDISLDRLKKLTQRNDLKLTADMAFLLEPSPKNQLSQLAFEWIDKEKESGNLVVGININPQLFKNEETEKLRDLLESYVYAMTQTSNHFDDKISYFLIPHDFREYNSDVILLDELFSKLPKKIRTHTHYNKSQPYASDVKAMVGALDVVLTGRMHVTIACLGQKTPIGCVVYQGKFEGLFNHFNLDNKLKLEPEQAADKSILTSFLIDIIQNRDSITTQIQNRLDDVRALSLKNIQD